MISKTFEPAKRNWGNRMSSALVVSLS